MAKCAGPKKRWRGSLEAKRVAEYEAYLASKANLLMIVSEGG